MNVTTNETTEQSLTLKMKIEEAYSKMAVPTTDILFEVLEEMQNAEHEANDQTYI